MKKVFSVVAIASLLFGQVAFAAGEIEVSKVEGEATFFQDMEGSCYTDYYFVVNITANEEVVINDFGVKVTDSEGIDIVDNRDFLAASEEVYEIENSITTNTITVEDATGCVLWDAYAWNVLDGNLGTRTLADRTIAVGQTKSFMVYAFVDHELAGDKLATVVSVSYDVNEAEVSDEDDEEDTATSTDDTEEETPSDDTTDEEDTTTSTDDTTGDGTATSTEDTNGDTTVTPSDDTTDEEETLSDDTTDEEDTTTSTDDTTGDDSTSSTDETGEDTTDVTPTPEVVESPARKVLGGRGGCLNCGDDDEGTDSVSYTGKDEFLKKLEGLNTDEEEMKQIVDFIKLLVSLDIINL